MKNLLISSFLALGLVSLSTISTSGCTQAQVKQAETDLVKVLQAVDAAIMTLDTPENIAKASAALSALAAIAPQAGPIHDSIIKAQAALVSLQDHQATVSTVQLALDTVINLLEGQAAIPVGAVRRHRSDVAPVMSK